MWLVLACLMPGVLGSTSFFVYQYRQGLVQQEKNTIQTVRALVQAVDNHLLRAQAVAQALSAAGTLARRDFAGFHHDARNAIALAGLGTNVVLRDKAGRQVLNTAIDFGKPLKPQAVPEQVREVFATGKPTISPIFIGPVLKRSLMSVDVPVVINGEIAYALGVGILPEDFNALLRAQRLPFGWVAGVFDTRGIIAGRTHSPEQFVGHEATEQLFNAMMTSPEGTVETTTKEGIRAQTFYSSSPFTHWRVAIGIPLRTIQLGLVKTLSLLAAGAVILLGISLMLARLMSRKIAHSVSALTAPAIALGKGESAPVPDLPIKEAAEVASAMGRAASLLQERAAELAEAHRLAKFGTWYWDLISGEVRISESLQEIYGRNTTSYAETRGTLLPAESWEQVNAASRQTIRTGKGFSLEIPVNHVSGHTLWVTSKGEPVLNEKGEVIALRGMVQDITERKCADQLLRESEKKLREAALHDVLTGLPNRALVMEFCERLVAASNRGHSGGALLFIDLDRFKPINDLYGHEVGDRVLKEVAMRLTACTRQEDLVGRLGGDEFVIVLPHANREHHRAAVVAQHVVASISQPLFIDALELSVSPSIGISFFPEHATTVSALIHTADLAMYQAKHLGRANYYFYTPELDRRAEQALLIETRLRNALINDGLALYYQPVIDLENGMPVGAEALLRLMDEGENIGPDKFIPVAESTGLIGPLGDWVVAEACRQQAEWLREGLTLALAVNVSPVQFRQQGFSERLREIMSDTGMDPSCLEIEVTESAVMENLSEAVGILDRIKSLGVKVALDDFGTGYSSLSVLTSLPLDKLKVDQSFVRRIEQDPACRAVTEAVIALGRSLRLSIHGEGIESEDTLLYLEEQGCHQAQGYWFSKPLPAAEFLQWYREQWDKKAGVSA